jgi:alkylation response protein AidB-like acyl-CoA dehydrogenase
MTNLRPTIPELVSRAAELGRRFARDADRLDRLGEVPAANVGALHDAGLLALTVSRDEGGHGGGLTAASAVISAIAQGEPSTALILSMHYSQHAQIARSPAWPAALASRLAREAVRGPSLINAAQVEPELGSPSFGGLPATRARRDGGQWRIEGHKRYVTGVPLLSWISVLAVTDEPEPRLGSFIVPRDAPGVRIVETWDPIGLRASASHDVVFEGAAVPLADVVNPTPARLGLQRDEQTMAWYFNLASTVYDGVARSARDWLLEFLNTRRPTALSGASLAEVPTVQASVGEIEVLLETSAWLRASHARAFDDGTATPALASAVKHTLIDNAVRAVSVALELAGNHGLARRNPLERHHRDVLCGRIHAPTNALLRANAGRAALRASAVSIAAPAEPDSTP